MTTTSSSSLVHQSFVRTSPSLTNDDDESSDGDGASHAHGIAIDTNANTTTDEHGDDDDDNDSYGPVTRLAHRAAAQDEAERIVRQQQQLQEQRIKLQATALAVGEAAWVIAKATTHHQHRQQQQQQQLHPASKSLSDSKLLSQSTSPVKVGGQILLSPSSCCSNDIDNDMPSAKQISPLAAAPRRRQIQRQQWHNDEENKSSSDDDNDDLYADKCDNTSLGQLSPQSSRETEFSSELQQRQQQEYHQSPPLSEELHSQNHHNINSKDNMSSSSSSSSGIVGVGDNSGGGGSGGGGSGGDGGGLVGGRLFASAKNWLQSQRERLHQLELERQVEDQRRKLVEEGRKQRAREAEERRRRNHRTLHSHHHSHQNQHQHYHESSIVNTTTANKGASHAYDTENSHNYSQTRNDHSLPTTGGDLMTSSSTIATGTRTPPTLFLPPILQDELCILPHIQGELCNLSSQQPNRLAPPPNNSASSPPLFSASSSTSTTTNNNRPSSSSFMCGFGSAYEYNPDMDDDHLVAADYPGVARVDSYGNILEMIPSGSLDDDENDALIQHPHDYNNNSHHEDSRLGVVGKKKVYMSVSSPRWTCSGEGMSVKVDIDDFNDDSTCEEEDDDNDDNDDDDGINKTNLENDDTTQRTGNNGYGLRVVVEEDDDEENEDDPYFVSDIKIVPETPKDGMSPPSSSNTTNATLPPSILRPSHMKSLISSGGLPPSLTFCKWKRLYSLLRDGDSFEQFLHRVEGHDRTVLVVKTAAGSVFGGYADTRWEARHVRRHASEYYGSAQAFLFRFPNYDSSTTSSTEEVEEERDEGEEKNESSNVIIYKWSGVNRYIQLCDASRRTIAFGGGGQDGDFGLCIEDDFRRGTTGTCSTFANEALCEEGYFFVMDLEVWGFTLDF